MKRNHIQYVFLLFNVYIGIVFYFFVRFYQNSGTTIFLRRPPSVEAYLPIAALMSLKYWVISGIFDPIHPAALAILLAAIISAVVLRRGFCSYICPVGTVSEIAHKLGNKILVNIKLPRFLDIPLRALKYLVLGFFAFAVIGMSSQTLFAFSNSPFNKLADVKLLMFFTNPSVVTITVLVSLFLLSLTIKNFWCRYLCPYGAVLGLLSKIGVVKVVRDTEKCIDCHKCEESCPSYIKITKKEKVTSAECTMCSECINACQETKALRFRTNVTKTLINPRTYGLLLVGGFLAVILIAQLTGHWQTNISPAEYQQRIPEAASPIYSHPQ